MQITTALLLRSPARATADEKGNIHFVYDATGRKWAKSAYAKASADETAYATAPADENGPEGLRWYVGNAEFLDGKIQHVAFPDGRFVAEYDENGAFQGTYRAEYFRTDHLGNTRLTFSDFNHDMVISPRISSGTPTAYDSEITSENHYYPFGLGHTGPWYASIAPLNKYRYNGKEWNADWGLGLYDFGNRWHAPTLGRFTTVDRFADKYTFQSPYVMAANDPMKFVDVNGDSVKIGEIIYSPGMETSENYDAFTNNTIDALNFIFKNGGKKHIGKLVDSERVYNIKESSELGTNTFEPISDYGGEIKFNALEAAEYSNGKIITAVTILAHEIDHAFKNEILVAKSKKSGNLEKLVNFQYPIESKAKIKEETRAMKGLERKIATILNQHIRSSYDENPIDRFITSGPLKKL